MFLFQVGKEVGAEKIGRCATPNDHPIFIEALASIVQVGKNIFSSVVPTTGLWTTNHKYTMSNYHASAPQILK